MFAFGFGLATLIGSCVCSYADPREYVSSNYNRFDAIILAVSIIQMIQTNINIDASDTAYLKVRSPSRLPSPYFGCHTVATSATGPGTAPPATPSARADNNTHPLGPHRLQRMWLPRRFRCCARCERCALSDPSRSFTLFKYAPLCSIAPWPAHASAGVEIVRSRPLSADDAIGVPKPKPAVHGYCKQRIARTALCQNVDHIFHDRLAMPCCMEGIATR